MFVDTDREPDFINEIGTKWWSVDLLNDACKRPDKHGITIDARCYIVELKNGERHYVMVQNNEVVYENQNLEAFCVYIDTLKILERD